jgi:hypothetical protein
MEQERPSGPRILKAYRIELRPGQLPVAGVRRGTLVDVETTGGAIVSILTPSVPSLSLIGSPQDLFALTSGRYLATELGPVDHPPLFALLAAVPFLAPLVAPPAPVDEPEPTPPDAVPLDEPIPPASGAVPDDPKTEPLGDNP